MKKQVVFLGLTCDLHFAQYGNGRTAIQLNVAETGEPMATATVNIVDAHVEPGEVIIKDYSENEGMLKVLCDAEIISKPKRAAKSGHIIAPICDLLVDPADYDGRLSFDEIQAGNKYWVQNGNWEFSVKSKTENELEIFITGTNSQQKVSREDFKKISVIKLN